MKKKLFLIILTLAASAFNGESVTAGQQNTRPVPGKNSVAAPSVNEKYEYHEVCGLCEKDLLCEMKDKAVRWNDGRKYDSVTTWKVKWDYSYERDAGACYADSFKVTVDVIFRLPKWARTKEAPQSLIDKWDSYMKKLMVHENGHRDIVLDAATELTLSVVELPTARSCAELDREIKVLCRSKLSKLEKEQKEYDKSTGHGKKQGALFP